MRLRKVLAILLLCLMLFNWIGYQLYIAIMVHYSEKMMIADLDQHHYSESDLISIKVPVTYVYYNGTSAYQRIDGHIDVDGVVYNYVKRRFFNDSLELLCIPNVAVTKLKSAKDAFFALSNGLNRAHPSKKDSDRSDVFKYLMEKYCPSPRFLMTSCCSLFTPNNDSGYFFRLLSAYIAPVVPPPNCA